MTLPQARLAKKTALRLGMLLFILVFVSLMDGCLAKIRQPLNVFHALPGATFAVDGPVEDKLKGTEDLIHHVTGEVISLSIDELRTGYWLGGNMWIGKVTVSPDAAPGEYSIDVRVKGKVYKQPPPLLRIIVHRDAGALRESSLSYMIRYLNIAPWWVALGSIVLIAVTLGTIFALSQRIERLLDDEGKAEIFMVREREGGGRVVGFGLGSRHGVKRGDMLMVHDEDGAPMGRVTVEEVLQKDSLAVADVDMDVRPGYIVSLR